MEPIPKEEKATNPSNTTTKFVVLAFMIGLTLIGSIALYIIISEQNKTKQHSDQSEYNNVEIPKDNKKSDSELLKELHESPTGEPLVRRRVLYNSKNFKLKPMRIQPDTSSSTRVHKEPMVEQHKEEVPDYRTAEMEPELNDTQNMNFTENCVEQTQML
eukprot:GAHX01001241.1.p1 GENE.GAHX01001241.1~~GAHX01001241.1.p1  ORF type:complete len:173 (-),score=40.87 GAHX01001241.1:35-511(-)